MKKLFLLLTLSVFSISAFAQSQNFAWAKSVGGTLNDQGNSISTDASGNIYSTGSFQGTVDFNPGSGTYNLTAAGGYSDIFVLKLDSSGNFKWAIRFGELDVQSENVGYSISIDNSENVLVTGYFYETADFDPGIGVFNLISVGYRDIFVLKLDTSGNFIWAKSLGGNSNDYCYSITTDAFDNVYAIGYFQGTVDFDPGVGIFNLTSASYFDIFILKLDESGNFVWAKVIEGTGNDRGYSISIDASENVYTTGYFYGTADFDPGSGTYNLISNGLSDIFYLKLNASGNFVWAKKIGGTIDDQGNSITNDSFGNIYSTGFFSGTVNFNTSSGTNNLTSAGSSDIFILKLDSSGTLIWAKNFGGSSFDYEQGYSISTADFGNVYTIGDFSGTADFNPDAGIYNLTSNGPSSVFISKLNPAGNFISAKILGGNFTTVGKSINVDEIGNVYSLGYFDGTADFDPSLSYYNLTSLGFNDIFINKLASHCDPPVITANGSTIICGNGSVDLTSTLGTSYQWYKNNIIISGASSQVYSATLAGSYKCVIAILCGLDTSNLIQVTKYSLPTITLTTSGSTTFCNGDSVIISASSNAGGFATWQWYKDNVVIVGATNNSYKATTAGTYKCTVTNSSTTCSRISTGVVVSILTTTASITAGSSTTFCIGGNVLLTAVTNAGAGSTYQWYLNSTIIGGATNATYTASAAGNYSFTVNNSNGCNATSSATTVTVNPLPVVTITPSGSTIICSSGTLSLTASTGTNYLWSTAATAQTIIVSTAGNYSVTVTNANGCSAASTPTSVSLSVCETPTNISVSNITGTKATVSWTGNSCAVKYRVRIRVLGTTAWTTLIVNSPTSTKTINPLQPLTTYEYQVRTDCNSTGTVYSAYSTIQTFTTICDCTKPTNIAVSNVSQTGATVSWLGNSCAVKYRLQYRVQGTTTWTTKTINAPTLFYNIIGLTNNTIYEYHLRSDCNSTGTVNSGWTTTSTITTPLRLEDSEISSSTFYVSPNPCSSCFVSGAENENDLIVTDIVGRIVSVHYTKSENGFYINMPDASNGLYLIRNKRTGAVVKFVKE